MDIQEPSDEQLIERYNAGDDKTFDEIVSRYMHPIYTFAYRYVRNEGDAQDITQDVFLAVWKHLHQFDEKKKLKAWIFTIAKHTALNWMKKKKPALFSSLHQEEWEDGYENSIPDTAAGADKQFETAETRERLSGVMEKLKPEYRTVVSLRYSDDLTFQEIAQFLNEPLNTVKSRHRRALLALKVLLT